MTIRKSLLLLSALALAGCGTVGDLTPPEGRALPQAAYGQEDRQTADALITPSTQTRPGRSDELLRRSERRELDPFDLPPGYNIEDDEPSEKDGERVSANLEE